MEDKKQEVVLEKQDYKFIDSVFKKYGISLGYGHSRIAEIILNELRISENYYGEKFSEYGGLNRCEEYFEENK